MSIFIAFCILLFASISIAPLATEGLADDAAILLPE